MNVTLAIGGIYPADRHAPSVRRPLFSSRVRAGFPSPAQDHIERSLDLNDLLATGKPSVFYLRLEGDSMVQAGMHEGDYLVVDRAIKPAHNRIVIAVIDGELTVKRLHLQGAVPELRPANPAFAAIRLEGERDFSIWGVVTGVVRRL